MIYQFKKGSRLTGDPQVVGQALTQIASQHGGELLPAHVVRSAKPKRNPLHGYFEWDEKAAAHQYRLTQARSVIRSIVLASDEDDEEQLEPVRAFVCIYTEDADGGSYIGITDAMHSEEYRDQVLQRAYDELQDWRRRYANLKAFAEVFDAIDAVPLAVTTS